MMDFDENCFFPNELDPLISGEMLPRPLLLKIVGKWQKIIKHQISKKRKHELIIEIKKSNWAQKIDKGPFKAFPVTGGITFTYGGLKVDKNGSVLNTNDKPINGLFACGELVGGVFFNGYPGGSGLTSGAVFGRMAGYGSVKER